MLAHRWAHKTSRTPPFEVWQARARHREERSRTYKGRGEVRKVAVTPPPTNLSHISQILVTNNNLWSMWQENGGAVRPQQLLILIHSAYYALHIVVLKWRVKVVFTSLIWRLCSDNKHLVLNQTELDLIRVQKQQRWYTQQWNHIGVILKPTKLWNPAEVSRFQNRPKQQCC